GETLFKNSIYFSQEDNGSSLDELWDESMPEKLIRNDKGAEGLSPIFYVFKSLASDTIITVWDMD
ncbi:MAG: hypothetical protein ABUT20_58180, partial [Bacteroidota bacterium]